MSMTSKLDKPDISVGRLSIWIHGRQFPDAQYYLDSNVLSATAEYQGLDSRAMVHGSFITLTELARFLAGLETLNAELKGAAVLKCREPNLHVELRAKSLGHIEVETSLTADQLTESHVFKEQMDQTFLPPILEGIRNVLALYPVREPDKGSR